jgi:sodium transport system permease protein
MREIIVIWLKEITDTIRDRRTLAAMIVAPLVLMPILTIVPQSVLSNQMEKQQEAKVELAVVGEANGPELVEYLQMTGEFLLVEPPEDLEKALQEGELKAALTIPPGFAAAIAAEEPVSVTISTHQTTMMSGQAASRVRSVIESFNSQVVGERMAARGVDPRVLQPVLVDTENLASEEQMGGAWLAMLLPMFIAVWAVAGGMYTAIDVTAGEKERGTLEPLLAAPAGRLQIVVGKLLAVVTTSGTAVLLSVLSMYLSLRYFGGSALMTGTEAEFSLRPAAVVLLLVVALPLVVMISSLEMAISMFARSFKQAQNYIMPLQLVVMLPAVFVVLGTDMWDMPPGAHAIPVVGPLLSFQAILAGRPDAAGIAISVGSSLLYAAICVALAIYVFTRERVLFHGE